MNTHVNRLLGFSLFFLFVGFGHAEDKLPVIFLPEMSPAPRIDGRLNDSVWAKAPENGPFVVFNDGRPTATRTVFKVLRDERHLYVGILGEEKGSPATRLTKHDSPVFSEDSFEIFVSPNPFGTPYYQFVINPLNTMFDAKGGDKMWNGKIRSGVSIGPGFWIAELEIPWKQLGLKLGVQPAAFRLSVCRNRYVGGVTEWSSWMITPGGFHVTSRFGIVVLNPRLYFQDFLDAGLAEIKSLVTALPEACHTPKLAEIRSAMGMFSKIRDRVRKGGEVKPDEIEKLYLLKTRVLPGAREAVYETKLQDLFHADN
ncbi:MAG: carbohydrate-binding family 9-like protein [Verrucomicrobia bacterium]|nr:carbohydrate-binding family 9-like protein [Verrucomicrobiota bacterium]